MSVFWVQRISVVIMAFLSVGCSIKQDVRPAHISAGLNSEICLIPAIGLRKGMTEAYTKALRRKGFSTRELAPGSSINHCPIVTTYTGRWSWDLALYMSYAEIKVYESGRQVGSASYDSRWGGGRLDKFVDAENKISEMTDQLFSAGSMPIVFSDSPASNNASKPLTKEEQIEALGVEKLTYVEYQHRYRLIMEQE